MVHRRSSSNTWAALCTKALTYCLKSLNGPGSCGHGSKRFLKTDRPPSRTPRPSTNHDARCESASKPSENDGFACGGRDAAKRGAGTKSAAVCGRWPARKPRGQGGNRRSVTNTCQPGLITGHGPHDLIRGSGREEFNLSQVDSGRA